MKHPQYAIEKGYLAVKQTPNGLEFTPYVPSPFSVASDYGTPIARDFTVDGKIHLDKVHYGGKYRFADGSATAPAISFAGATGTGFNRVAGTTTIATSIAGTEKMRLDSSRLTVADDITFKSGTAFGGIFEHNNSDNRTYTFPDQSGTVALTTTVAPIDAEYIVATANAQLTGERVATDTATISWDFGTAAQGKANVVDDSITFAKMQEITTDRLIGRDTALTGNPEEIAVGGGIEFTGGPGIQTSAFTGDVTKTAGGTALTIANDAVTFAKMQDFAANTILLRNAGTTGDADDVKISALTEELTPTTGDWIMGEDAAGNLRKYDVGNLPTAAGSGISDVQEAGTTVVDPASILNFTNANHWVITDGGSGEAEVAINTNAANGIAGLDGGGLLPTTIIPSNALLDGSKHSDTAAALASRGSIIIGNSGDLWSELVKGSTGKVLTAGASDVSWEFFVVKGYIFGLTMSNAADTVNDITVAAGEATDEAFTEKLVLSSAITKQLDAAWAVGTNAGGINTGSVAADTWYEVHLIKRVDTGVVDVMFTTTANRATLPANYTLQRRIGWIRRNSTTILQFTQVGDYITLVTQLNDASFTATASAAAITLTVPPSSIALFRASLNNNTSVTAGAVTIFYENVEGAKTPDEATAHASIGANDIVGASAGHYELRVSATSTITHDSDTTTYTVDIGTFGWIDDRKRDA